jgi:hypothetical protein
MGYGFPRNDYGFVLDLHLAFWKPFRFIDCFLCKWLNLLCINVIARNYLLETSSHINYLNLTTWHQSIPFARI